MDGNNSVGGYSDQDLTRRMKLGSQFFTQGNYADAASCFRHARDASIQIHGESSLECAIARYSYGLSLLCQVPVPVEDPLGFVPKEVDYYEGSELPFPSSSFRIYIGDMEEKYVRMQEDAKGELNLAWSLLEYRIDNYLLKANILSALGEVAFRRGESNPQRYYFEALSIFDSLLGENHKRVADMYPLPVWCRISLTITLCVTVYIYIKYPICVQIDHILASEFRYVKLLICLEGSDESKAIAHGNKAWLIYYPCFRQLLSETPSATRTSNQIRGSSSVTQTDPSIQQKKDEAKQLLDILTELAIKLERLEKGSSLSLPPERTSVTPAGLRYARGTVKINTNLEL